MKPMAVVGATEAGVSIMAYRGELNTIAPPLFALDEQADFEISCRTVLGQGMRQKDARMLSGGSDAVGLLDRSRAATVEFLLRIAAHLVGAAVPRVATGCQFGPSLGSFGALTQWRVGVYMVVERALPSRWCSAHLVANRSEEAQITSRVAEISGCRVETWAKDKVPGCCGGIGFTRAHHGNHKLKSGKALEQASGTLGGHRRRRFYAQFAEEAI